MSEELDELKEAAERAKENRSLAPVSFTMAFLAVCVATVTLLGHRAHTEEILLQTRATDQWAYYQAKNIRLNNITALNELLSAEANTKAERVEEVQKHFKEEMDKYAKDKSDLSAEARSLEAEVQVMTHRANRFDLGEVFLEIALVVTSITLLTDKRAYWYFGMILGAVGLICAATGLLIH